MPNIENAFFPSPVVALEQKPRGTAGEPKGKNEGKIGGEEALPSFMTLLTQFAEDREPEGMAPNAATGFAGFSDSTFSAESDEADETNTKGTDKMLSSAEECVKRGDNRFFSNFAKPVLDLLVPLQEDQEKDANPALYFEWANESLDELEKAENKVQELDETNKADERTGKTPSLVEENKSFFSKPVLDLLASLKNDLEKDVDTASLFEWANGVLSKTENKLLSDEDAARLKTMVAEFRDLLNDLLKNDDLQPLVKTALADLALAIDAWPKYGKKGETEVPLVEETDGRTLSMGQEQEKTEAKDLFPSTPFHSYVKNIKNTNNIKNLKTDVSGVSPKGSEKRAVPEEETEGNKEPSSKIFYVPGQGAFAVPALPETSPQQNKPSAEGSLLQGNLQGDLQRKLGFSNRTTANTNASFADADLDANVDVKADWSLPGGKGPKEVQDRKTGFEQFFDGVMARRGGGDVGGESLALAKETPLARNEALREGLDNVVRFIRVSGEQKAALIVEPPALGRVSVELTHNTGGLEASIKVGSEQARQLIQDQLAQLRWSLAQQGVQLTHFSVDVEQENGRREQDRNSERGRRVGASVGSDEGGDEETVFRVDLNQGLLYWVA
ncbi:MAG: flagellar hook-length control protein FliK [Synergistaceae bacterium]|nr:flagellar hook-length control protein FliK [Synergistaceae bacterium]